MPTKKPTVSKKAAARPANKPAAAATPDRLNPLELGAVAIAAKAGRQTRDFLTVGNGQAVDFTVRISGQVDVAADSTAAKNTKPDLVDVLAVVLAHLTEATAQKVFEALIEVYPTRADQELPARAQEMAQTAVDLLTLHETGDKRGSVTGLVECQRVATKSSGKRATAKAN